MHQNHPEHMKTKENEMHGNINIIQATINTKGDSKASIQELKSSSYLTQHYHSWEKSVLPRELTGYALLPFQASSPNKQTRPELLLSCSSLLQGIQDATQTTIDHHMNTNQDSAQS